MAMATSSLCEYLLNTAADAAQTLRDLLSACMDLADHDKTLDGQSLKFGAVAVTDVTARPLRQKAAVPKLRQ